jgi:hypothetical protein
VSPRLIAYGLAALAVAGLYWRYHYVTNALADARAEASQLHADYSALKAAYAHSTKIAKDASDGYQADLKRLEGERSQPLSVRVCKPAKAAVPAQSGAASGSSPTSPPNNGGEVAPDIGPDIGAELLEFGIQCEANALQLDRLIQWTKAR